MSSATAPAGMRIGIDLGGTKTEIIALGHAGDTLHRERVATPRGDYDGTVRTIVSLVDRAEAVTGRRGTVGIGIPGMVSPATGLVKNANSTWLIGHPLNRDLEAALTRPVRLANDANCFALSEATDGAGAGCETVFGVIVGTGTGGGIAIRQAVITGVNAIAGEWGHNPLPWPEVDELPGPACYCGRHGCLETWLSGPALSADYARRSGRSLEGEAVVSLSAGGDLAASATLDAWTSRLARGLATIINVLDPDVIVMGGGLSRIERLYTDVPRLWPRWVFSDHIATRLVPAKFGDASGVRGAAWLWNTGD
jgi:fructokinase